MFYPVEALRKGGRFYLCWVADSWPLRFATITHRQLWSQDIRKICDDMLKVMTAESGRPVNRFSLRLSSQLMRGLVRLYQRKVTIYLSELCMLNAHIFKHSNKKFNIKEKEIREHVVQPALPILAVPQEEAPEEQENEHRVAELIQSSGNIVGNIQDITLKESAIPDFQLPPNDGFGEEHPDQAFQLIADRTIETMMQADRSAAQHSGLEVHETTDLLDKTRLQPQEIQMERLSEHDVTLFSNAAAAELRPTGDFEKDIPEIPEIPIPEIPVPEKEKLVTKRATVQHLVTEHPPVSKSVPVQETSPAQEKTLAFELEELEENELPAKKRRKNKLIIDKTIKISSDDLRVRIGNPDIELRCQDSSDDVIDIRLPAKEYFRRPCKPGGKFNSKIAVKLTKLFLRNLSTLPQPMADREMEEAMAYRTRRAHVSNLPRIEEEPTVSKRQQKIKMNTFQNVSYSTDQLRADITTTDQSIHQVDVTVIDQPRLNITTTDRSIRQDDVTATDQPAPQAAVDPVIEQAIPQDQIDIADLPTQKLEASQPGKRKSSAYISPKRRTTEYVSSRHSQEMAVDVVAAEANKENIPENSQMSQKQQKALTSMLEKAGLADIAVSKILEAEQATPIPETVPGKRSSEANRSSESETLLGSVDRTRVSLGDSAVTTESLRFIRDQWGTTGTLTKIMKYIEMYRQKPLTVWTLLSKGPVISEYKNIIAARCFTSILKLKQHGFIIVRKDPESLEIIDIALGPKFDDNVVKNIFTY